MSDGGDANEHNDPKPESQSEADEHTEQAVQQTQWHDDPKPESQAEADEHTEQAVAATTWQGDPAPMSAASADQIVQTAVNQTQWTNVGTGIRLTSNPGISVFFTVSLDVVDLGMWSKMSGLGMTIATTDRPDTAMSFFQHHLPGHMTYSNIVLERPVSADTATVMNWVSAYHMLPVPTAAEIQCVDQSGSVVMSWDLLGVTPVSWKGPSMDVYANNVATEVLTLAHMGFM
jgi:phage tail-like protein